MNGDETDVDCGGTVCGPCDNGGSCNGATDCASGNCPSADGVCCDASAQENRTAIL